MTKISDTPEGWRPAHWANDGGNGSCAVPVRREGDYDAFAEIAFCAMFVDQQSQTFRLFGPVFETRAELNEYHGWTREARAARAAVKQEAATQ